MQELTTFLSSHILLTSFAIILLILVLVVEFAKAKKNKVAITPAQTTHLINHQNGIVLDIRPNEIFQKGHIINAISFPTSDLKPGHKKLEKYKTKPIILVCDTGVNSQKFAVTLLREGYNIYSLAGGMRAWVDAQLPIVKD